MRRLILFLVLALLPSTVFAEGPVLDRPHWSLEIKGGKFYPDIEDWKTYYGSDRTTHLAGSLAYKILRQVEVGIEGGYIWDEGVGFAPIHNEVAGTVKFELYPLQAFVLLRGVFSEGQWIVPYVGGGWTRMYYREKIENQATVRGSTDGYHGRAGIQLLLDNIDPSAASKFYLDYGVHHTYLFFEAQSSTAKIDTISATTSQIENIDLGGVSYLAGLLFEF
jgi:hypothetical protein